MLLAGSAEGGGLRQKALLQLIQSHIPDTPLQTGKISVLGKCSIYFMVL